VAAPAGAAARIELALAVAGPLWSLGLLRLPRWPAAILPEAGSATRPAFLIGRLLTGVAVLVLPTTLMAPGFPLLARAAGRTVPELHQGISRLVAGRPSAASSGDCDRAPGPARGRRSRRRGGCGRGQPGAALAALAAQRALTGRPHRSPAEPVPPLELDRPAIALLGAAAVSGGLVLPRRRCGTAPC